MLLHTPVNLAVQAPSATSRRSSSSFQSLKFIVGFAVEINETNLFDDIVLPYPSYLERYDFITGSGAHSIPPCGQHDFHWQVRQPVVELPGEVRHPQEVMDEIAERVGILGDMYRLLNHTYMLKGDHVLRAGPALPHRRDHRQDGALLVRRGAWPGVVPRDTA